MAAQLLSIVCEYYSHNYAFKFVGILIAQLKLHLLIFDEEAFYV
jgi:hypothetical protein